MNYDRYWSPPSLCRINDQSSTIILSYGNNSRLSLGPLNPTNIHSLGRLVKMHPSPTRRYRNFFLFFFFLEEKWNLFFSPLLTHTLLYLVGCVCVSLLIWDSNRVCFAPALGYRIEVVAPISRLLLCYITVNWLPCNLRLFSGSAMDGMVSIDG